jgi:hypothetical protein
MYTNDATTLGKVLSREVSQVSAVSQKAITEELAGQKIGPRPVKLEIGPEYGLGLGLSR